MSNPIEEQILAMERRRCDALLSADVAALDGLLSDRLVFAHATAKYEDKQTLLEKMEMGNIVYKTLEITEPRVVDLGDTALLVSRLTADVTVGGQPRKIDNMTLLVWGKEAGQWRMIAYQPTAIPR